MTWYWLGIDWRKAWSNTPSIVAAVMACLACLFLLDDRRKSEERSRQPETNAVMIRQNGLLLQEQNDLIKSQTRIIDLILTEARQNADLARGATLLTRQEAVAAGQQIERLRKELEGLEAMLKKLHPPAGPGK